jgi:hypothetical protein
VLSAECVATEYLTRPVHLISAERPVASESVALAPLAENQFFSFFVSAVLACSLSSKKNADCNPLQSRILHQFDQQHVADEFMLTRFPDPHMFLHHANTVGDAKRNTTH